MFLKKIELNGFKSFANKTEFDINKGITAVVGPNGSGKSNIIDGIKWVLGEQSAKTLRGAKMEDVIFAGSDSKRQKNYAEVSLTFDNNDKKLNLDYSEITITRRIFRDGESEYFINKTNCRLKDIHELFMDTGIGREAYSIISQGQVEEVLSSRPEEKRIIFEEAAGIVKYKNKKKESLKKLEETEQNLTRVDDILYQHEQDMPQVKEQAEKAKKYKDLKDKLKGLEVSLVLNKIESLEKQYEDAGSQISLYKNQQNDIFRAFELTEENHQQIILESKQIDDQLNRLRNEEIDLLKNLEESKYTIQLNTQQIEDGKRRIEAMGFECAEIENEISENEKQNSTLDVKLNEAQLSLSSEKESLHNKENNINILIEEIDTRKKEIDELKEKVIDILNETATLRNEIKNLEANVQRLEGSIEKKDREEQALILRKSTIQLKLDDYNNKINDLNGKIKDKENTLVVLNASTKKLLSDITQRKSVKESKLSNINELSSKIKALNHLEASFAGYNIGPKEVLKKYQKNPNLKGSVAQLITVPDYLAGAIEIALGSSLQYIVVEDDIFASQAVDYLKSNKLGRATFLPLNTVKGSTIDVNIDKGVIGVASKLIDFNPIYSGIINFLLGRIIIVDNIKNGLTLARTLNYKYRIVSLDGEVINAGGSITGGKYSTKSTGLLQRSVEIEQLKKDCDTHQDQYKIITQELSFLEEEYNNTLKISKDNEIILNKMREESRDLNQQILLNKQEIKGIQEHIDLLEQEKKYVNNERTSILDNIQRNNILLEEKKTQQSSLSNQITKLNNLNTNKIDDYESLKSKAVSKQITIVSLEQEIQSLKKQKVIIQQGYKRNTEKLKTNLGQMEKLNIDLKEKESVSQKAKSKQMELEERKILQSQKQKKYQSIKTEIEEKLSISSNKIKDLTESKEHLISKINNFNLKKSKILMELDGCTEKLLSEYFLTVGEAKDSYSSSLVVNERDCQKQVNILREDLKGIGEVNLGAIEEYNRVTQKMDFLQQQKDDLNKAKLDLKKIIFEMDKQMATQFESSFERIKESFSEVFKKLFNGGRGYLRLTEPDNILESGVEIFAQPPGKKLQSMMLLSGGEKALTAIALLFAILITKPSPFCVLDEIEASLDEANVDRFGAYLKEMATESQFIVVTHRKGTMESADILYGITMEEFGISKQISVNLNNDNENSKKVG
ncbi:chromosome segregation protein SMC [Alkalicella caledoniensis]|uniref:Chromosome partition protein Smc n=1 Tax=Alkalicella caledoniensis TaxID=2731377 RepID=A0A7G9WCG5_ALKCA|nr:chromosome segregation protein SMC [Alkalicella caledoniensis]QNO16377.1 chromosome segregation protein SMC [Alkalicella caledoniensis]